MNRIVVNLKGGLGNQLFQYAAGRGLQATHIACGREAALHLSTHSFSCNPNRDFRLDVFKIRATIDDQTVVERVTYPYGMLSKARRLFAGRVLKQFQTVHFDPRVLQQSGDVCLDGYFQSEQYFSHINAAIRDECTLKTMSIAGQTLCEEIKQRPCSVSIHVRGGDYLNHPHFDNICTSLYYQRAVAEITTLYPSAHFFVFTNDSTQAAHVLPTLTARTDVTADDVTDQEALVLMSTCNHHIIANSSYSWWGAWLNADENKRVFAPDIWAQGSMNTRFRDTIPESWKKIPIH